MNTKTENGVVPPLVEQNFWQERKKITSRQEWISFSKTFENLYEAAVVKASPFDPRFNAVHWALDVYNLCRQITFSYCLMNSYAEFYKKQVSVGSQLEHVDFHVSYFADNCITRIDSCRDKLALMVWAFYCPFNPEKKNEILDYQRIVERLRCPIKFGLKLKNQNDFLKYLEILHGTDFQRVETYRHRKIHRREPRIEIYGIKPHHDWLYMFPLVDKGDIARWERKLEKRYTQSQFRELIKKGCYINGVLFDERILKDRLWDFEEVRRFIKSCMMKLFKASEGCFRTLRRRSPLRKNQYKS